MARVAERAGGPGTGLRARRWPRAGVLAAVLLAAAACARAPAEPFGSYVDAAEAVNLTTLDLLDDYVAAIAGLGAPEAPDVVPAVFDPFPAEGAASADVQSRRNAVETIRDYNAKMLFLAEGGSYPAVQERVGSLTGLLAAAIPGLGAAGGFLGGLAGQLEAARSAREFRDVLRAARVPHPDGTPCAERPVPPAPAAGEALPQAWQAVACQPIVDGLYRLMKADTAAFYAAQFGSYQAERGRLADDFGAAVQPLGDYADRFRRPTDGAALGRLIDLERQLHAIERRLVPGQPFEELVFQSSGAPLDDAALATLAMRIDALEPFAARSVALDAAIIAYHRQLRVYVGQIDLARAYLGAVEEAAVRPVDNIRQAERLIRLGLELEGGAVRSREAIASASRILLGTD